MGTQPTSKVSSSEPDTQERIDDSNAPGPADPKTGDPQDAGAHEEGPRPDPTRYGDWEKNGRCIDF